MTKLNQVIAIEKGVKSRSYSAITEINKNLKPEFFNGFTKTYQDKDEDGEKLPAESKRVQFTVPDVLRSVARSTSELMDVTAKKDWSNCTAKAPVMVDGVEIIPAAPVSYLLFLEKQLADMNTLAGNLPILDEGENWAKDANSGLFKANPTQTHRTKKVVKVLTLVQPTPEHPGQAQPYNEDIITGFWTNVKSSGAMPKPDKQRLLDRIEVLLRAVKEARESANMQDVVPTPNVGESIFNFLYEEAK